MKRKRFIKLIMSLLYQRNEAVDHAKYINQLMQNNKKATYSSAWKMLDEYDRHYEEVMTGKGRQKTT